MGRGGDPVTEEKTVTAVVPAPAAGSGLSLDMPDVIALNGVITQVGTTLVKLMPRTSTTLCFLFSRRRPVLLWPRRWSLLVAR